MNVSIRSGRIEDVDILVEQHIMMFKEIYPNGAYSDSDWNKLKKVYGCKLKEQIATGQCAAFIAGSDGEVFAGGVVTFIEGIPVPYDTNRTVGYIHSVYTYPQFRGRGCATDIMNKIIDCCKEKHIVRITLQSSEKAINFYFKLGFKSNNGLSLVI